MKAIFVVVIALIICAISFAQESPESCEYCVSFEDATCSGTVNCVDGTNCTVQTFHVGCDGEYCLGCKVACPSGGNCSKCVVCAYLYDDDTDTEIASCQVTPNESCTQSCTQSGTCDLVLYASTTYRIHVCLWPCTNNTCANCQGIAFASCKGVGIVWKEGSPCQY